MTEQSKPRQWRVRDINKKEDFVMLADVPWNAKDTDTLVVEKQYADTLAKKVKELEEELASTRAQIETFGPKEPNEAQQEIEKYKSWAVAEQEINQELESTNAELSRKLDIAVRQRNALRNAISKHHGLNQADTMYAIERLDAELNGDK